MSERVAARGTILETARLRLRRLVPADLDPLGRILDEPEVVRYLGSKETQLAATRQWLEVYDTQGYGMLTAELKATGAYVGRIGFAVQHVDGHDEVEVGWVVAREHWGRGLATEAARALLDYGFRWHRFPRIISLIDPANAASIAVARKIGETHERDVAMFGKPVIHVFVIQAEVHASTA